MISRLTSDMDSISELFDGGVEDLVLSALAVVSTAVVMLLLDVPLALVSLILFPVLLWLSRWFQRSSAIAYRRTREAVALVIVHFVESMGGIRAVQAFGREPRNEEIFEAVNRNLRNANVSAWRLIAVFSPGIKLIGNVTIAIVLTYGGYRVLHGQTQVGVLAAFLLYLRKFFDPMQDLSQFYNSLQSGTAADNIRFGRPKATDEEVVEAARAIGADGFIQALPEGYDTDVRKRGGRLSAGQRQLVAFARAFLADPAVLILDEATSSLDIPSERLVQRALRTILADRTAIVIAHRLSTVEIADRVLVLDAGRIVEDGTPAQLISGGGRYATLHQQWADSLV